MSFDERDIRRGMDVYAADDEYLGSVVRIVRRPRPDTPAPAGAGGGGDSRPALPRAAPVTALSSFSGERLGPMPTATLGNAGPASQTGATAFATEPTGPSAPGHPPGTELIVFRWLVALDWRTLRPALWRIPLSLVRLVALERIVLATTAAELGRRP